jgi:glucokinase
MEFAFQRVILLNDLEAIASAVPILEPEDLTVINEGVPDRNGAIAVIAPGTGLGEAYLTWDGQRYRAHPSEGGHADFAPSDVEEQKLLEFLRQRFDHVSYERICSGMGIPNIYDFLLETGRRQSPEWLSEELARSPDRTPVIVRGALDPDRQCEICREALSRFVSILGSEAGNLALKVFATGGVYLAGGIPPKIASALIEGNFMEAFSKKGRFSSHMRKIPVYLIQNEHSALMGAANYGLSYSGG